jgi:hypothetical protein
MADLMCYGEALPRLRVARVHPDHRLAVAPEQQTRQFPVAIQGLTPERRPKMVRHPLDRRFPVRLRDARSSQAVDPEEVAANAFAAELLMPTIMLEHDLSNLEEGQAMDYEDEAVIRRLSSRYKVSLQAMIFRLVNLGIIDQIPDLSP